MQSRLIYYAREGRRVSRCAECRGFKRLCGKTICPILVKARSSVELEKILKEDVFGSSPPAVFVGTWNYPKVLAGPLIPPLLGEETAVMDSPEMWLDKRIEDLLRYRFTLIRGKTAMNVEAAENPSRLLQTVQEIVMASHPTDAEAVFTKKPTLELIFSSREAPVGPSATIDSLRLSGNPSVPSNIDKIVNDTDLKTSSGMVELYDNMIPQQQIVRLLSIGLLGTKKKRKLVPTEWSITATDDILGKKLHEEVTTYPWVNEFMVFGYEALHNNVLALFMPSSWMFEALECWLVGSSPKPDSDHELFQGRTNYASKVGGAYYASRLPVLEYLKRIRRQAGVITFLEVKKEWIPLGVFRFREILRVALANDPAKFSSLEGALNYLRAKLNSPLDIWIQKSKVLSIFQKQSRITSWLK